jgi:signal transduction histidine kinase
VVAAAAMIVATCLAVVLAASRSGGGGDRPVQAALLAVMVASVLAARPAPLVAGACCLCAYGAYGWRGFEAATGVEIPVVVAFFVVGLRGGTRVLRWLAVPTAVVGASRGAVMGRATLTETVITAIVMAFLVSVPMWAGVVVARLREGARLQRERAERAARLADVERAAGVAQERTRIARELHDIVAHRLSAIAVQAHAGEHLARRDPDAAAKAFAAVAEQATHGIAEMHGLLGVLREPVTRVGVDARPGLGDLPALLAAEQSSAAHLRVTGVDRLDALAGALDDEAGLALYRVVQESLSNARRHAPGAPVQVEFTWDGREAGVVVDNGRVGPLRDAVGVGTGGGFGLLGMRERIALCGGAFEAGPTPDGGWRVTARIRP